MPRILGINRNEKKARSNGACAMPDAKRGAVVFLLFMLPACTATFPSLHNPAAEENTVAPQPEYADTYANQPPKIVAEQVGDETTAIAQLLPSEENPRMQFESIDQTDPCVWAQQKSVDCSAIELSDSEDTPDKSPSAEMRLKMSGLMSHELGAFDADQTIDEIGRGRATSIAAQAVGEEFLSAHEPFPETSNAHPDPQTLPDHNVPPQPNE